jgi:hypothetical protein
MRSLDNRLLQVKKSQPTVSKAEPVPERGTGFVKEFANYKTIH